jgi:uncharacterized protein
VALGRKNVKDLKPTILIMTKAPQAGLVKTRLRPLLSDGQCAELSKCFLSDTVQKAHHVTSTVIVAYYTDHDDGSIFDYLTEDTTCIKQTGNNLGERLTAAVEFAISNGGGPIVVVGTDSPTLPCEILRGSLQHLTDPATDLVLGGTDDGGYYLIGVKKPQSEIFKEIPWGSSEVYSATLDRAKKAGITGIVEMPRWFDVDTPEDLTRLFKEVLNDDSVRDLSPMTCRWLFENQGLFVADPSGL